MCTCGLVGDTSFVPRRPCGLVSDSTLPTLCQLHQAEHTIMAPSWQMTSVGNGTSHATQEQHIQIQAPIQAHQDHATVSVVTGLTGRNKSGVVGEVLPAPGQVQSGTGVLAQNFTLHLHVTVPSPPPAINTCHCRVLTPSPSHHFTTPPPH